MQGFPVLLWKQRDLATLRCPAETADSIRLH